jgi:hypothetical protein
MKMRISRGIRDYSGKAIIFKASNNSTLIIDEAMNRILQSVPAAALVTSVEQRPMVTATTGAPMPVRSPSVGRDYVRRIPRVPW